MAAFDPALLSEFLRETYRLLDECETLLEQIESDFTQAPRLEEFSNKIDRVMGAAKSLALMAEPQHPMHIIGDITGLCKVLSQRASNVSSQQRLFEVTIAFLLDAVEITRNLTKTLEDPQASVSTELKNVMVARTKWISDVYKTLPKDLLDIPPEDRLAQDDVDAIIKKLGDG